LFDWIESEHVLNRIAAGMVERPLRRGDIMHAGSAAELFVVAEGEVDLVMGAHLVETLHRGGYWGEASVLQAGGALCEARVAEDGRCFAVPGELLVPVPGLLWGIQESFDRRLHSFRSGFRFEWSEGFRVDVPELDDQHQRLFHLANTLSEAIQETRTIAGHDAEKKALLDFTREHFATEEALLRSRGYGRLEVQAREHAGLVALLERFIAAGERRRRPRSSTAVDYLKDWLIRHTLLEDQLYRPFLSSPRRD
jgi:hemerythrin